MTTTTIDDYREAIVEAVADLDRCDGSRIGQSEAIDSARTILQTTYGDELDSDVETFIDENEDADGSAGGRRRILTSSLVALVGSIRRGVGGAGPQATGGRRWNDRGMIGNRAAR